MMQSGLSRELFEAWCSDKKNGCIVAGYCVEVILLCILPVSLGLVFRYKEWLYCSRILCRGNITLYPTCITRLGVQI